MRLVELFNSTGKEARTDGAILGDSASDIELLPSGGVLVVVLRLDQPGRLSRLAAMLALPIRLGAAERALGRAGAVPAGRYGLFPSLESPTLIYPLSGPAAVYAEHYLVPSVTSSPASIARAALRRWTGCDASLGAVLVLGRKP